MNAPISFGVRVTLLEQDGEAERELLLARAPLEAMARQALAEPAFDLMHELRRPFARCFAAWTGAAEPAGFLIATRAAHELHVLSVVVEPRLRRMGIGRALTARALHDARDRGQTVALLEVRRSNIAAVRLYRSQGFVAVRVRKDYYPARGEAAPADDAVEMAAELQPGALAAFGPPLDLA